MNLLIILYLAYANVLSSLGVRHRHTGWLDRNDERVIAWEKSVQKYERKRIAIDATEQLALKSTFQDIENAYTNYQVEVMVSTLANVSNRIDCVQDQLFKNLQSGIARFFAVHFIQRLGRRSQFATPSDFERFLASHTQVALFIGECCCRRNDYLSGELRWVEYQTFGALKEYVDLFRSAGREEFAIVAQKFLDKWIEHVESEQGFIRRYAHFQQDMSWPEIHLGKITPEGVRRSAISAASPLIKLGYTPKWLDEFFDTDELKLIAIYGDIKNAYTNGQIEAMTLAMARVSPYFGRTKGRPQFGFDLVLKIQFRERFINGDNCRRFESLSEFEHFVTLHMNMALFLCECDYEDASVWDEDLMELERKTFLMLRAYVDKFHGEGKRDFVEVAQKNLDAWIAHIDSKQSFTCRIYNFYKGHPGGGHFVVRAFIEHGYTPKWLDEFK